MRRLPELRKSEDSARLEPMPRLASLPPTATARVVGSSRV